ncbi:Uncharacterised protein [Mycobacteroides abscessus subsp. abscessus]|nr:Uncharacterised protein [Mycobacteroides abscessus subsp. abscessus]
MCQRAGSVHQIADEPVEPVQIIEERKTGDGGLAVFVVLAVGDRADEVLSGFGRLAQCVHLLYDGGQTCT